jgi:hypothetical protein
MSCGQKSLSCELSLQAIAAGLFKSQACPQPKLSGMRNEFGIRNNTKNSFLISHSSKLKTKSRQSPEKIS